jgi:hypothetical protein
MPTPEKQMSIEHAIAVLDIKTVKVRIAVAVNSRGEWNAGGHGDVNGPHEYGSSDNAPDWLWDGMPDREGANEHLLFVEADVPMPQSAVIHGVVVAPLEEPHQ